MNRETSRLTDPEGTLLAISLHPLGRREIVGLMIPLKTSLLPSWTNLLRAFGTE